MAGVFTQKQGNIPLPVQKPTIYQSNRTYEKGNRIASGGYGHIHIVTRPSDHRVFAMKTARQSLNVQATINKEITILSALRHAFIISLEDTAGTDLKPCLIMEMALSSLAAEGSRWRGDEGMAKIMSRQILAALQHVHGHNIAHRDVKADNILVFGSEPPTFKLADFGCAENIVPAAQFRVNPSSGIPKLEFEHDFLAEKGTWNGMGEKMDIYAFGLVLYQMLTSGALPPRLDDRSETYAAAMRWRPKPILMHELSSQSSLFITVLLTQNERFRPGTEVMLKHPWLETRIVPEIAVQESAGWDISDIERAAGELPSSGDETARSFSELNVGRGRKHRKEPYPVRDGLTLHAGHTPAKVASGQGQGVIRTRHSRWEGRSRSPVRQSLKDKHKTKTTARRQRD
ncbi:kinase-like domain-containing protein [Delphinella strobiligena]|nr:kinase-like domain-containing protein [Delphinella strobiligena]